jgi:hypothetical protein
MADIRVIGLDIAKSVFQLHGVDASGATVLRSVTVRGVIGEKTKGRPYQEVQYARRALVIG